MRLDARCQTRCTGVRTSQGSPPDPLINVYWVANHPEFKLLKAFLPCRLELPHPLAVRTGIGHVHDKAAKRGSSTSNRRHLLLIGRLPPYHEVDVLPRKSFEGGFGNQVFSGLQVPENRPNRKPKARFSVSQSGNVITTIVRLPSGISSTLTQHRRPNDTPQGPRAAIHRVVMSRGPGL